MRNIIPGDALLDLRARLRGLPRREASRYFSSRDKPGLICQFHPMGSKGLEPILLNSSLYLSSPANFNDPFEFKARLTFSGGLLARRRFLIKSAKLAGFKGSVAELKASERMTDLDFPKVAEAALAAQAKLFGVCCFASGSGSHGGARNILMWSHYASKHKGLCFLFHPASSPETFVDLFPVEYTDEYLTIDWAKVQRKNNYGDLHKLMFRKSPEWGYEMEHRIALANAAGTSRLFRPEALRAILLGAVADPSLDETIAQLSARRLKVTGHMPCILRANLSKTSYRLNFVRDRNLESSIREIAKR